MGPDSPPAALLLDDGELDDVRALLGELGISFAVGRGAAAHRAPAPASLLIATPRYLLVSDSRPEGFGTKGRIVQIAVVDDWSQSIRGVLERAECDFVVRRPVHPSVLLHLLRDALYRGPERRRLERVAIGAKVKLRAGLRSGVATLVDLSLPGCRLLSKCAVERERRVSVTFPAKLAGGKPLKLSGRVVRVQEAETGGDGTRAIAVGFDRLNRAVALRLRSVLVTHAKGPAVLKEGAGHARAPSPTSRTDSKDAEAQERHEPGHAASVVSGTSSDLHLADEHRHLRNFDPLSRAFEAGGDLSGRAGPLSERSAECQRSAEDLEESGENLLAAEAYRALGNVAAAARCYERAYDLENALECYRTADDMEKVIALLEEIGDFFAAGKAAAEATQWDRAIHNLRQVDSQHEQYGQACELVEQILRDRGDAGARVDALRKEDGWPAEQGARMVAEELSAAADALERARADPAVHLLRAASYREQGDTDSAARELEAAGYFAESAELHSAKSDHERSAQLFEKAGIYVRAAEEYRTVSELRSAARCYERAYEFENAIRCYKTAGDVERMVTLLEKIGDFFEAGRGAADAMQWDRAIHDLQRVDSRHGQYGEACDLIAEILSERGEIDLAIEKLEEACRIAGAEDAPLEMQERYARLLEEAGRVQDALTVYERIGRRDPSYSDVNTRAEALRKKLSPLRAGTMTVIHKPAERREGSRYEILAELGRGGMGVVYRARDRNLGRIVALKLLPESLRNHPDALGLFEREARSTAPLNHANIVTLYDAGKEGSNYFISMEYLEGAGLDAVLQAWGPLETRDVAALGLQVAAGLDYAQQNCIVHRDIKPSNLFLTREQVVKIMDFGLAKVVEEVRRYSTVIGGTPVFMAPEQAVGGTVDHRTDLYSLGATFFNLVTNTIPFEEGDLAYHHAHTPPPDPRERVATIPAAMAELILQLMAKSPEDRCQSAREVEERLRRILRG
jgi:tetratricopeptide (TPR) repeat protein